MKRARFLTAAILSVGVVMSSGPAQATPSYAPDCPVSDVLVVVLYASTAVNCAADRWLLLSVEEEYLGLVCNYPGLAPDCDGKAAALADEAASAYAQACAARVPGQQPPVDCDATLQKASATENSLVETICSFNEPGVAFYCLY